MVDEIILYYDARSKKLQKTSNSLSHLNAYEKKAGLVQKSDSLLLVIFHASITFYFWKIESEPLGWNCGRIGRDLTLRQVDIYFISWTSLLTILTSGMGQEGGLVRQENLLFFTFMLPRIVTNFFLIKPTDALISQIYFCQETLHVSGISSAHHQGFSTVHSALV